MFDQSPPSPQPLDVSDTPPGSPPKKRKMVKDDFEETILLHFKERAEEKKQRRHETDDDHISRHVASMLKRLPNGAKAIARLRVEQLLLDVEFPEPHPPSLVQYQSHYN